MEAKVLDIALLVIGTLFTLVLSMVAVIMNTFKEDMRDIKDSAGRVADSIATLNVKIAIVIERTEQHDERIARLEEQVGG